MLTTLVKLENYIGAIWGPGKLIEWRHVHAARATRSIDLPTSHHPFLSRPDLVTEQLIEVLRTTEGATSSNTGIFYSKSFCNTTRERTWQENTSMSLATVFPILGTPGK